MDAHELNFCILSQIPVLIHDANAFELYQGNLVPKKSTFPSGIKALADYVHGKGLKLGIYSDAGY